MSKQKRLEAVNELILKISGLSRRFFYSKKFDRVAKLSIRQCRGANIIFTDEYTGAEINVRHHYSDWWRFNNGGTLKNLVKRLANYIQTGEKLRGIVGYCFSDENVWGYEELDVKKIEELADRLGITGPSK